MVEEGILPATVVVDAAEVAVFEAHSVVVVGQGTISMLFKLQLNVQEAKLILINSRFLKKRLKSPPSLFQHPQRCFE
jgi:hypothetical protein